MPSGQNNPRHAKTPVTRLSLLFLRIVKQMTLKGEHWWKTIIYSGGGGPKLSIFADKLLKNLLVIKSY